MKKTLLIFCFCASFYPLFSQSSVVAGVKKTDISIYPNPATEFIALNNDEAAGKINVYNLTGRLVKSFGVERGTTYPIEDLPNGLYLVQIVSKTNKSLTTQRLNKRSAE